MQGRGERFFVGMSVAIAATVFLGFARTYYLKPFFDAGQLLVLLFQAAAKVVLHGTAPLAQGANAIIPVQ